MPRRAPVKRGKTSWNRCGPKVPKIGEHLFFACFFDTWKKAPKLYSTTTRSRIQQNDSKFCFGAHQLLKTDRSWHCSLCILGSNNSLPEHILNCILKGPTERNLINHAKWFQNIVCTVCIMGTKGWKWKYSWYTVDIHNSYNAARTESAVHVSHALPLWEPEWIKWIKWPANHVNHAAMASGVDSSQSWDLGVQVTALVTW